jgi:DNA-binding response OmpR family regulator
MEKLHGNVLIVEDDEDTAETMMKGLGNAGYGVRKVASRDAALPAMERYIYDYIILDYAMPGMSVEDFLIVCRTNTENIILTSAVVDCQKEAVRIGLKRCLQKPFSIDELIDVMRGFSSGLRPKV